MFLAICSENWFDSLFELCLRMPTAYILALAGRQLFLFLQLQPPKTDPMCQLKIISLTLSYWLASPSLSLKGEGFKGRNPVLFMFLYPPLLVQRSEVNMIGCEAWLKSQFPFEHFFFKSVLFFVPILSTF